MTSNTDLLYSILAMDVYHRQEAGDGGFILRSEIPQAKADLQIDSTVRGLANDPNLIGFSAMNYTNDGKNIIVYRGTDDGSAENYLTMLGGRVGLPYPDAANGYGIAVGIYTDPQATAAIEFYKKVVGAENTFNNEAMLVGQSLGGGLAGFVAALYGRDAFALNTMHFQNSATLAYLASKTVVYDEFGNELGWSNPIERELIYGNSPPIAPDFSKIRYAYVVRESMEIWPRPYSGEFELNPHDPRNVLDPKVRHTASTVVTLQYAQGVKGEWSSTIQYLWPAWISRDIATAVGFKRSVTNLNNAFEPEHVLPVAIAYTAVDEQGPFGTAAIRAMFNDANDLAQLIKADQSSYLLKGLAAKNAIGEIIVQYAGDLAAQSATDFDLRKGALVYSQKDGLLQIDLDPAKWVTTYSGNNVITGTKTIVGRDHLIDALLANADVPQDKWQGEKADVTRLLAAIGTKETVLNGSDAPQTFSGDPGGVIFVGAQGKDQLVGGVGKDLLIGGDGDDMLRGADGNDLLLGGAGNDILIADSGPNETGAGDVFYGGEGADTFVLGALSSTVGHELRMVIEDATAQDRLVVPYNFFNGSGGVLGGSVLMPILGGMYRGDAPDGSTWSDTDNWAEFAWQLGVEDKPWFIDKKTSIDSVNGVYPFLGQIQFSMEGSDLLVRIWQAVSKTETVSVQHETFGSHTYTVTFPDIIEASKTEVLVKNWQPGVLGINMHAFTLVEHQWPIPNTNNEYVTWNSLADWDGGVNAITNGGAFLSPLPPEKPAPDLSKTFNKNEYTDGSGNPNPLIPIIVGQPNNPIIDGTEGPDVIQGGTDDDTINGFEDDDYIDPGTGSNTVDGGTGSNTISYNSLSYSILVTLGEGTLAGGSSQGDVLLNFDNIVGTAFDDTLVGNNDGNQMFGRAGSDTIMGNGGNDLLLGEAGDDLLMGGGGDDVVDGGDGSDTAVFAGERSDYTVTRLSNGDLVVVDLGSGSDEGYDQLHGVEFLQFADVTIAEFDAANHAPVITGDLVRVAEYDTQEVVFTSQVLLSGASDAEGDTLTVSAVGNAEHGTVQLTPEGDVLFAPEQYFVGEASFTYTVSDGNGGEVLATGRVLVMPENTIPVVTGPSNLGMTEDTPMSGMIAATDADGDTLLYAIKDGFGPEKGSVSLLSDGTFTYEPFDDANGSDSFTVVVSDLYGGATEHVVTVNIAPINDAPIIDGQITGLTTGRDTPLVIGGTTLLQTASDVDGDSLTIASLGSVQHGTAVIAGDGSIVFTPEPGYTGEASFDYTVSDGQGGTVVGHVTLDITAVTGQVFNGTSGNDVFAGTSGDDLFTVSGDGGFDQIDAGDGYDVIRGSVNGDIIRVATGLSNLVSVEEIDGGDGSDRILGTSGNDVIDVSGIVLTSVESVGGGAGDDTITGTSDNDWLWGDDAGPVEGGNDGADTILGGAGDDYLYGEGGGDTLNAGDGDDRLYGGSGSDSLIGALGNDIAYGESGDDVIWGDNGVAGESGNDGNDVLSGGAGNDVMYGQGGDDVLIGDAGADMLYGGSGSDNIKGGDDDDLLMGEAGQDLLRGDGGNDALHGGDDGDVLWGDVGDDALRGDGGNDELHGGDGIDSIIGGADSDLIFGDDGADQLWGDFATGQVIGLSGNDTIYGGAGNDVIHGEAGDDLIFGEDDNDQLTGEGGNDTLDGGAGNDNLYGEDGNDTLLGAAGADFLIGGTGNDILDGGTEADYIWGGDGDDSLIGGSGTDWFMFRGNFGRDVITDWQVGEVIDLRTLGVTYEDLTFTQTSEGTEITAAAFAGNTVVIAGASPTSLAANQFLF